MRVIRIVELPAIDAALARFSAWWDGLSRRERVLVGTLGALLGIVVLVYGVVKPLQAMRAQAYADIRTYETLNARLRVAGSLAPRTGPAPRSGAPADVVTQAASAYGLQVQAAPTGAGVRVTIVDASYDAVVNWMADVARTTSLAATRVQVTRGSAPGRVAAVVEYRG
jgi:general secretion pathway protein M